jgi:hypothetical protein
MVVEGSIIAPDGGIEVGVTPRSHEGQVLGDMHRIESILPASSTFVCDMF